MDEKIGTGQNSPNIPVREVLVKHWTCRQLIVMILSVGALVLAYLDPDFRPTFGNLVSTAVGGYLGQMFPQGKD